MKNFHNMYTLVTNDIAKMDHRSLSLMILITFKLHSG